MDYVTVNRVNSHAPGTVLSDKALGGKAEVQRLLDLGAIAEVPKAAPSRKPADDQAESDGDSNTA